MTAAKGDLYLERWAPVDLSIPFEGFDFTGVSDLTLQIRDYPDAPGDPLLALAVAAPPTQGLSMAVATVGGLTTSTLRILIGEATLEALLPYPANGAGEGESIELAYAVHFSATAYPTKRRWLEGAAIIVPGANQA